MIISKTNNFIFIKTKKTAGTSVEIALSVHCGAEDIITPLDQEGEELRRKAGGNPPQNYQWDWTDFPSNLAKDFLKRPKKYRGFLKKPRKRPNSLLFKYDEHTPAKAAKALLGQQIWRNYYTFAITRNPWDMAISAYSWQASSRQNYMTLEEYIERCAERHPHKLTNWHVYTENDQIIVDEVIKFENLSERLAEVGRKIGIPDLSLPEAKAKGRFRNDMAPAGELLSDHAKKLIAEVCAKEIAYFGYTCP